MHDSDSIVETIEFISSLTSVFKHNYQVKAFTYHNQAPYFTGFNIFEKEITHHYDTEWIKNTFETLNTVLLKNKNPILIPNISNFTENVNIGSKHVKGFSFILAATLVMLACILFSISNWRDEVATMPTNRNFIIQPALANITFPYFDTSSSKEGIDKGRNIALIIGIDKYLDSTNWLENCVNDGRAIEKVLIDKYGFFTIHLYDSSAIKDSILFSFNKIEDELKPNDNLLIYYSGHGTIKSGKKSNAAYWVPQDAKANYYSLISEAEIKDFLLNSVSKAQHVLLISDACFSGNIITHAFHGVRGINDDVLCKEEFGNKSVTIITSGGVQEVSDDVFKNNKNHNVFAGPLIDALKVNYKNKNNYCDAQYIFGLMMKEFPLKAKEQLPRIGPLNGWDSGQSGEFIFRKLNKK